MTTRPIVYLREVDAGTANACWVICIKGDPGAVAFAPYPGEPLAQPQTEGNPGHTYGAARVLLRPP